MKKYVLNIFAVGLAAAALCSCDSKNEPIDNMVYIDEAVSEPLSEIVIGATGTTTSTKISVRTAQRAVTDTKVKLSLDKSVLDTYNHRNDADLEIIPSEYISFPAEVTIPAGSASVEVPVEVTSFDGAAGVSYAAPIKVTSATGTAVSEGSGAYIITFGKVLIQKAPGFLRDNAMSVNFAEGETIELPQLTLEWWARCTNTSGTGGFSINNQAMFSFGANYELYVRFGDLTYSKNNFLQIKCLGIDANYDSGDPLKTPLQWGQWYHFAHTYDSATGDVKLYQNGVEVNAQNGGAGKVYNVTGITMCGAGSYHRDVIEMCQVRLWKTCRSAAQIAKNYKKEVKYNDPNLVLYLPMNEGSGSDLHDVTGNGHDVVIGSKSTNPEAYSWTEYTFN